jgi:hypothetical protein
MAVHVDRRGIQKTYRQNPDGSMTRLSTRLGHNEYVTDAPKGQDPAIELYLESGAQTVLDDSENPSVWEMLDLIPPKDFMGWVIAEGDGIGKHSRGALNTGNASNAMIEPARKPVAKKIPPSLFSGSMRLFIQAQYGAKGRTELYTEDGSPFSYGVILTVGSYSMGAYDDHIRSVYKNDASMDDASNLVLYYLDAANENTSLQLGFSVSMSCGIYRSKKKYWVITIARSGASYAIKAYPLKFSAAAYHMRAKVHSLLKSGEPTADERQTARQCMAYAFAYAKIDTANVVNLGSFAGPEGYPLAYGWKWNSDGTEARIITHKATIAAGGSYWTAYEGKLTIAYTDNPYLIDEKDKFAVDLDITDLGHWKDHQNSKIYRPLSETVDLEATNHYRLHQTTVAVSGFPAAGGFGECTDRPIYGFYVDEEWTPLLYSNFTSGDYGSFVYYTTQSMHGYINLGAGSDLTSHPLGSGIISLDYIDPGNWYTLSVSHVTSGANQQYHYKMVPKEGVNTAFKFGDTEVITVVPNAQSTRLDIVASFVSGGGDPTNVVGIGGPDYPTPQPFYQPSLDFYAACYEEQVATGGFGSPLQDFVVENRSVMGSLVGEYAYATRPANTGDPIALVIPHGDAEAVFMLTGDDKSAWTTTKYGDTDASDAVGLVNLVGIRHYVSGGDPPVDTYVEDELVAPIQYPVYRNPQLFSPIINDVSIAQSGEDTVNTFVNGKVPPAETPDEVVYADFWEPTPLFYEAGMYALSGTGTKFITSEGLFSDNIAYEDRFCGWV